MLNGTGSEEEIVSGGILRYFFGGEAKIFSGGAPPRGCSLPFFLNMLDFACFLAFSFFSLDLYSKGCTDAGGVSLTGNFAFGFQVERVSTDSASADVGWATVEAGVLVVDADASGITDEEVGGRMVGSDASDILSGSKKIAVRQSEASRPFRSGFT